MGSTTEMYIENLVIGLQSTVVFLFVIVGFDHDIFDTVKESNSVMEMLIVLPFCYVLGIAMDRISNRVFGFFGRVSKIRGYNEKSTKRWFCKELLRKGADIKCQAGCFEYKNENYSEFKKHNEYELDYNNCKKCSMNISSILVWKHIDEMTDYRYTMSRKRILRSTVLNSLLCIFVVPIICVIAQETDIVHIVLVVLGFLLLVTCAFSYKTLIVEYYKKERKYAYNKMKEEAENLTKKKTN